LRGIIWSVPASWATADASRFISGNIEAMIQKGQRTDCYFPIGLSKPISTG
jgi:hypothetical protein